MAFLSSSLLLAFVIPTEEPAFEGFTKQGYGILLSIFSIILFFSSSCISSNICLYTTVYLACFIPMLSAIIFVYDLSMEILDESTPQPT